MHLGIQTLHIVHGTVNVPGSLLLVLSYAVRPLGHFLLVVIVRFYHLIFVHNSLRKFCIFWNLFNSIEVRYVYFNLAEHLHGLLVHCLFFRWIYVHRKRKRCISSMCITRYDMEYLLMWIWWVNEGSNPPGSTNGAGDKEAEGAGNEEIGLPISSSSVQVTCSQPMPMFDPKLFSCLVCSVPRFNVTALTSLLRFGMVCDANFLVFPCFSNTVSTICEIC